MNKAPSLNNTTEPDANWKLSPTDLESISALLDCITAALKNRIALLGRIAKPIELTEQQVSILEKKYLEYLQATNLPPDHFNRMDEKEK